MKRLVLKYHAPAENSMDGWEQYSLPIGNGYFGASIFGRTDCERIQFTTNTFANTYDFGGVSNFAEIYIDFRKDKVEDYERGLSLNGGFAYTQYTIRGNRYESNAFYSYPDKVFVYRIKTLNKITFNLRLAIPYLNDRPIEEGGRTGEVYTEGNSLVMRGKLPLRDLIYEGRVGVVSNGEIYATGDCLSVQGGTETLIYFAADTSYLLDEKVFLEDCHNAIGPDPSEVVKKILKNAPQAMGS